MFRVFLNFLFFIFIKKKKGRKDILGKDCWYFFFDQIKRDVKGEREGHKSRRLVR